MLDKFEKHIKDNFSNLLVAPFILACSGGVDSVLLVHLCAKLKLDFAIAHCNFRLRGEESDRDELFVQNLAKQLNIKFYITHFDTIGYINKNKVNVQIAARELRYAWFAELLNENKISTLVTAHHADDNLETFLINLSRGTGINGLTGIPEKTEAISRPLLRFSRQQILQYAKSENLKWVDDSSNKEVKYLRNKIRHEVVPLLKELHPTFLENFEKTRTHLADSSKILDNHIQSLKARMFIAYKGGYRIAIAGLQVLRPQKAYLYGFFKEYGFTAWDDILRLLSGLSGKEVRSKSHRLIRDREDLLLEKLTDSEQGVFKIEEGQRALKNPLELTIAEVDTINEIGDHILYVDKEALKYPLVVRKWEKGDYFYPFGMNGKKKLSKYFKDEKVDILSKEKQWILCSENDIVWVIGRRSDQRFVVTSKTAQIVKFTMNL